MSFLRVRRMGTRVWSEIYIQLGMEQEVRMIFKKDWKDKEQRQSMPVSLGPEF